MAQKAKTTAASPKAAAKKTAPKKPAAKAAAVKTVRKVAPAKKQSKIEHAIQLLKSSARGIDRYALQKATGMSRLLSSWDMENLATDLGMKVDYSFGATAEGGQLYKLVAKSKAAAKR